MKRILKYEVIDISDHSVLVVEWEEDIIVHESVSLVGGGSIKTERQSTRTWIDRISNPTKLDIDAVELISGRKENKP